MRTVGSDEGRRVEGHACDPRPGALRQSGYAPERSKPGAGIKPGRPSSELTCFEKGAGWIRSTVAGDVDYCPGSEFRGRPGAFAEGK